MLIYWVRPSTKELFGVGSANESPLEPGVFAIPADATTIAPMAIGEKQAAVFADGAWSLVADRRGEIWFSPDRVAVEIVDLGNPADLGLVAERPADPAPTAEELTAYAAERRYAAETGGVVSPVFGHLFTDRETRAIIGQAIQSIDLGLVAAPVNFKTPGGFVGLTRAQFVALSGEIVAHVQACFDREGEVVADIAGGVVTTREEIDAAFSAFG